MKELELCGIDKRVLEAAYASGKYREGKLKLDAFPIFNSEILFAKAFEGVEGGKVSFPTLGEKTGLNAYSLRYSKEAINSRGQF